MSRHVLVMSGMLGLALVCSYLSWTSEEGTDADDTIVVLDGKPEQIASVVYTSEKLTVKLEVKEDKLGSYAVVTTTEQKRKPKPKKSHDDEHEEAPPIEEPEIEPGPPTDAPEDAPAEAPVEEEPEVAVPEEPEYEDVVTVFKGGKSSDELLESLAPFVAKRALRDVPVESYEDYGLTEPTASLVVTRSGKEAKTYQVGGEAYGTRDLYLLDEGSGQVYLMDKDLLRPLKYAPSRMPDRELLGVEMGDVTALRIESPAGSRELEQRNRADSKNAFFAAKGSDEKDEAAALWLDKALALKASGTVQPGEEPKDLATAFALTFLTSDGPVTLVVSQGTDPEGKPGWYASSEHTRGLVELHEAQASEANFDLDVVFDSSEEPLPVPE